MNILRLEKTWDVFSTDKNDADLEKIKEGNSKSLFKELRINDVRRSGRYYQKTSLTHYKGSGHWYRRGLSQGSESYLLLGKTLYYPKETYILRPRSSTLNILGERNKEHRRPFRRSRLMLNQEKCCEDDSTMKGHEHNPACVTEILKDLKKKVGNMKAQFDLSKMETESLAKEWRTKETKIREHKKEIKTLKEECRLKDTLVVREVTKLKRKLVLADKDNVEILNQNLRYGIETARFTSQRNEIKKEVKEVKEAIDANEFYDLRKEVKEMRGEKDNIKIEFSELKQRLNDVINMNKCEYEGREEILSKSIVLSPEINVDFVWKIYNWREAVETMSWTPIFSEAFFSNGYRLCLRLYIDGDNIGLYCFLVKGDNDERLSWPMRRVVTLSIVNQVTLRAHKTTTFHYDSYRREKEAFERPRTDRNYYCIGCHPFIRNSAIKGLSSVVANDSVVVSCVLNDP